MNENPCDDGCAARALEPQTPAIAWNERPQAGVGSTSVPPTPLPRVLVVEDDIFFRALNTEVLSHAGFAVEAVEDGAAAWEALNASRYDVVVTDNRMPNVSGVELLRRLHAAHITVPVVMATGAIPTEELNPATTLQPVATLLKPYAITELVRTVKKALNEAPAMSAVAGQMHTE